HHAARVEGRHHVGGLLVRLTAVGLDLARRDVRNRRDLEPEPPGRLAIAAGIERLARVFSLLRKRPRSPDQPLNAVAVHAVLTHAFRVSTAPAQVRLGVFAQRGPPQEDRGLLFQYTQGRVKHDPAPRGIDARHHGPRRGEGVDLPDAAPLDADLGAIVVDGA